MRTAGFPAAPAIATGLAMHMSSIWAATASPAPRTSPLTGPATADVLIVGGGYTGISAALRLAEGGTKVVVLEAEAPGFGASGRNGGQVIPGLKYDPDYLAKAYGDDTVELVGGAPDLVFQLIKAHAIACDAAQEGWIQPSVKEAHLPTLNARARQWEKRGAPVEILDRAKLARLTGSDVFVGGWIDRRAGRLHPLDYIYGLIRAAMAAGAQVFSGTRATAMTREDGRWVVTTQSGATVTAEQMIIGTNGYTDGLWPRLRETVIPANSFQVATIPLDAGTLRTILPEGSVVSDSRRVANYFRIGPEGRLMMGGRGSFAEPRSGTDYAFLNDAIAFIFPQLKGIAIDYCWAGRIAMTRDFLPHVHQPAPGVTVALGYNGRGVALGTAMGTRIAAHLLDGATPLPLKLSDMKPLPLHGLHRQYATAMIQYYRIRDALER